MSTTMVSHEQLAPGLYRTPAGRIVEVVGTIVGDQVVYIDGQHRRVVSGPLARQYFQLVRPSRRGDATLRKIKNQPKPDNPRGGIRVFVYGIAAVVVLAIAVGLAVLSLPKAEL